MVLRVVLTYEIHQFIFSAFICNFFYPTMLEKLRFWQEIGNEKSCKREKIVWDKRALRDRRFLPKSNTSNISYECNDNKNLLKNIPGHSW